MARKRRPMEVFSMSFLDCMSCGFGAGTAPPAIGLFPTTPIAPILSIGSCPTNSPSFFTQRALPPGLTITGTTNFFAGVRGNGYAGRDTTGAPAGRIWILCATCGMTQYNPTTLTGLGLDEEPSGP